jgi:hypothetical protein
MRKLSILCFLPVLIFTAASCKRNQYKVNISDISIDIKVQRLEKDLFTLNPEDVTLKVPALRQKYKGFLQLFSYVINTGDINDPSFGDMLVRFCTDRQNNEVYDSVQKVFPDVRKIEEGLHQAFRYYRHYIPEKPVPAVYTCITGFNNSIITGDSVLGISLDRYLGANSIYYPQLNIYKYLAARMTPENIVPDCIYGWAASEWDFAGMKYPNDNVLAEMIHFGKLKYFEKCMLPEISDEILFGFTASQVRFCRSNEDQMWQYLIEKDLIFNADQFTIRKLTGEAPFTSFFTKESPGRAAVWIGFRIVESYMQKNKNISMEELMKNTDIQSILEKAKYSPH